MLGKSVFVKHFLAYGSVTSLECFLAVKYGEILRVVAQLQTCFEYAPSQNTCLSCIFLAKPRSALITHFLWQNHVKLILRKREKTRENKRKKENTMVKTKMSKIFSKNLLTCGTLGVIIIEQ